MRNVIGLISIILLLALVGCSSGDSSSETTGITSDVVITSFGSMVANGIEWETATSHISSDGQDCNDDSCLKVGMKVHIEGMPEDDGMHGRADKIDFRDEMEGMVMDNRVDQVTLTGEMDIMGHTVKITTRTAFNCDIVGVGGMHQVAAGHIVEISGYSSGAGTIDATRMECKEESLTDYLNMHPEGMEVKGIVADHDEMNQMFSMGNMDVSYSGADISAMPQGNWDGLYVQMHSIVGMQGGYMMASKIALENGGNFAYMGNANEMYQLMGMITEQCYDSHMDMDSYCMVNGRKVLIDSETSMHDHEDKHMDMMQMTIGMTVKVNGHFNMDRDLVGDEIEALTQYDAEQEYNGVVESVSIPDPTNILMGTVTLSGGSLFHINYDTMMEDDCKISCVTQDHFNLSHLVMGDHVVIHAYMDNEGDLIVIKLKREDG